MFRPAAICLLTAGIAAGGAALAEEPVPTYRATYDVFYQGRRVGSSEFSVVREGGGDAYRFESRSRFRGLLRLISPRPLVEISRFAYDDGRIRPLAYSYDDGTRRGEDNYRVTFDWENGVATTIVEDQTIRSELEPGILDRGSMQVALMLDMRAAGPDTYTLVDEDGVREYRYAADGRETLETPLGAILSKKFIQSRVGSPRQTVVWVAEELDHLPIRIEQRRSGETRAAFHLRAVTWLESSR